MAAWLLSLDLPLSLGRNVLVGVSIGLGIGIGIGAGMAASRRMFTAKVQDQNLVVRVTELTEEIRELRCVMVRLEVTFSETRNKRIVSLNDQPTVLQSDEETEEDEYYEMSGEEASSSVSDIDQLKTVIDEVERLHSNNNAEDKRKIHKLLQECVQVLLDHTLF